MKKAVLLAMGATLALWAAFPAPARSQSADAVLLVGGHLFTGRAGGMTSNPGILIRGGKILALDPAPALVDRLNARLVRLQEDRYVLPGIVDMHAHYNVVLMDGERTEELQAMPLTFLANGVTSTFPAGEYDPEGMEALGRRIAEGAQIGPRLFNSGPYFGTARPGWDPEAMTPDSIAAEVDHWAARGVRGFKAKRIRPAQLQALITAAHRHGLTVTGHLGSGFQRSVNPRDAILMGMDRIEHFLGGDAFPPDRSAYASFPTITPETPGVAEVIELYKKHGVRYDATITAYGYFGKRDDEVFQEWTDESRFFTPEVRAWNREHEAPYMPVFDSIYDAKCDLVKAYFDAGGELTLGTDHASTGRYLSGFGAHRELHAMVRCGIPPEAALEIGTLNGARALGMGHLLGSVEAGKLADLFVVRGNPLEDIRNSRNVTLVMKAGQMYDPGRLLDAAEGRIGPPER